MTMGTDSARNRLRVGAAGRVAVLMAAATVTAVVPAAAATAGTHSPPAGGRTLVAGDISTVAGGKGPGPAPATSVAFSPCGVSFAGGSFANVENPRVRVVAAATGTFYGQAMTAGDIYTVAGGNPAGFSGDGGPATSAELNNPVAVAVTAQGSLVIADSNSNRIRAVTGG